MQTVSCQHALAPRRGSGMVGLIESMIQVKEAHNASCRLKLGATAPRRIPTKQFAFSKHAWFRLLPQVSGEMRVAITSSRPSCGSWSWTYAVSLLGACIVLFHKLLFPAAAALLPAAVAGSRCHGRLSCAACGLGRRAVKSSGDAVAKRLPSLSTTAAFPDCQARRRRNIAVGAAVGADLAWTS